VTHPQDQAFQVIEALGRAGTEAELELELSKGAELFGYEHFFMTGLPTRPSEHIREYAMVSGWPEEWLSRYSDRGYVHVDPVIRKIRVSTMPFMWEEAFYDHDDQDARRVMDESPSFGLVEGMTVPIHDMKGFHAGVCFSAPHRVHWTSSARAALHLIAIYAHGRASAIISARNGERSKSPPPLSARETECLKWSSAGKSAWDISVILGISTHTAAEHLQNASRKLDTVNRVQAVAEALRLGLIL